MNAVASTAKDFPSYWEGLSLRHLMHPVTQVHILNFPSFLEGLSLRLAAGAWWRAVAWISLPFWKGFH